MQRRAVPGRTNALAPVQVDSYRQAQLPLCADDRPLVVQLGVSLDVTAMVAAAQAAAAASAAGVDLALDWSPARAHSARARRPDWPHTLRVVEALRRHTALPGAAGQGGRCTQVAPGSPWTVL